MRSLFRSLVTATGLAAALPLGFSAAQGLAEVGPVDPNHGFPEWYADGNGLQLDACLTDVGLCVMDGAFPLIDPNLPFPDNYGGVFNSHVFYNVCEATIPTNNGGQALLVITLQGAFNNDLEAPINGDQDVFARWRIRVDNLIQGETYTVTTPVGTLVFVAENSGVRGINFTDDVGRAMPGVFDGALSGALGPFLTWDSDLPVLDGNGREYVGNPNIPHTITGSPNGNNFFRIDGPSVGGPGINRIETDLFTIIGVKRQAPVVIEAPVASFTAAPTSGTEPLSVAFSDTSSGPITAWSWDFGDASGSALQNPTHSYAAGTYSVSLTVSGPGGTDTATATNLIAVAAAPIDPPVNNDLTVSNPVPSLAGQVNTWTIVNGTPGRQAGIYAGLNLGASLVNLGPCGGLPLGLARPFRLVGRGQVGPDGTLVITSPVPAGAAGRTYRYQAIEPSTCRTSAVISDVF